MDKSNWFTILSPAVAVGFWVSLLFWLRCGRSIGMAQNKTPIAVVLLMLSVQETLSAAAWLTHTELRWSFTLMTFAYMVKINLIGIVLGTGYIAWRGGWLK